MTEERRSLLLAHATVLLGVLVAQNVRWDGISSTLNFLGGAPLQTLDVLASNTELTVELFFAASSLSAIVVGTSVAVVEAYRLSGAS